jgi:hypothetical protein
MKLAGRDARPTSRFVWQGALILLPVVVMALMGPETKSTCTAGTMSYIAYKIAKTTSGRR